MYSRKWGLLNGIYQVAGNLARTATAKIHLKERSLETFSDRLLKVLAYEQYDDYTISVKRIADEYNVPYYDFNLIKEEYFPIQDMKYFVDAGHLNADGAAAFTDFFYEVASGIPTENEKLIYGSFHEKLLAEEAQVVGMHYHQGTAEELARGELSADMYRVTIASNRENSREIELRY